MKQIALTLTLIFALVAMFSCKGNDTTNKDIQLIKDLYTDLVDLDIDTAKYMDESLVARLEQFVIMTDANPIIDGQDYTEEQLNTLNVVKDRGHWYTVTYQTMGVKTTERTKIQIKVENGKITEIYPWDVDTEQIDQIKPENKLEILQGSADEFIHSFYKAYTDAYIAHNSPTAKEIKALADQHTTQKFKQKIEEIRERLSYTPEENYDLIIDNITFDKSFRQCLKVTETEDTGKFIISYIGAFYRDVRLTVHVIKQGDTYLIDDIEI